MSLDKAISLELVEKCPASGCKGDQNVQEVKSVDDDGTNDKYDKMLRGLSNEWNNAEMRVWVQQPDEQPSGNADQGFNSSEVDESGDKAPIDTTMLFIGDREDNPIKLQSVTTKVICDSIDDLDNELKKLISGKLQDDKELQMHEWERMRTQAQFIQDVAKELVPKSPKADRKYYIFFIILFLTLWAAAFSVIITIKDYNPHWVVYVSSLYVLATLSIGLDLFDKLPPFISYWENFWNIKKLAIRFDLDWPTGDLSMHRRKRREIRQKIVTFTKDYMGWGRWCSMRYNIRSEIEDKSLIISASISNNKDREHGALMWKHKDSLPVKLPKCVKGIEVLSNVEFERRAPHLFLMLFFVFSLADYILLTITDEEDGYDVPQAVVILADVVFFYMAITFMVIALLSNWTWFSFACSQKAYIQGLLNISILGFFVLTISRFLRPPQRNAMTWHKYHDWNKQIEGIVLTVVVLWIFFVLFFVISIAAFAEFAKTAANWGVGPAFSCFIGFAMIIMLAPPAPGNIIDFFGGYLIVWVLLTDDPEHWTFLSANALAVILVVVLHYTGACFQWMIGRRPFAQQWMNRTFPIEMLATSDAVLGDANWFKVGLVGFVFLDTANGLNQGRIEMEFWTQLFSEWGAFPNGLCLVTFGATIAIEGMGCSGDNTECSNYNWTGQAIPLLFIMSGITQILGTSFGAGALAGSLDTDKYIMSREKWCIVHRMMGVGYIPTKTGWQEDVYELAKTNRRGDVPYFQKACQLQKEWLKKRKKCQSAAEVTKAVEAFKHERWIPLRYRQHMKYLLRKVMAMEEYDKESFVKYFRKKKKEDLQIDVGMWNDVETNQKKKIVQCVLVVVLTICFYFGIFGFYMALDFEKASEEGLEFLWNIEWYYWISAGVFVFVSCIYYFNSVKRSVIGFFGGIVYFIRCCPVDKEIETGFLTPIWEKPLETKKSETL